MQYDDFKLNYKKKEKDQLCLKPQPLPFNFQHKLSCAHFFDFVSMRQCLNKDTVMIYI